MFGQIKINYNNAIDQNSEEISQTSELIYVTDQINCVIEQDSRKFMLLAALVNILKKKGFPIHNRRIGFFSYYLNLIVNCGYDPLPMTVIIDEQDLQGNNTLKLFIYEKNESLLRVILYDDIFEEDLMKASTERRFELDQPVRINENEEISENTQKPFFQVDNISDTSVDENRCKRRTKERKIGVVVRLVYEWRKYNFEDSIGLEEAAKKLKISKKSLDDYYNHIKIASKHGFDFNARAQEKIGVLRNFVAEVKEKDEKRAGNKKSKKR